jgi:hypothetical protein
MNLIQFKHRYDFGHEYYVQLLSIRPIKSQWSLLQFSVSWNDFPGWPYLQITFGSNGFFSILFWVYKFGFDIDFFSRTWNWDHLTELDEEDTDYLGMDEC